MTGMKMMTSSSYLSARTKIFWDISFQVRTNFEVVWAKLPDYLELLDLLGADNYELTLSCEDLIHTIYQKGEMQHEGDTQLAF